jgi:ABC-type bacteriocin/lantibiotic exporter with double-glycine peptidase domain
VDDARSLVAVVAQHDHLFDTTVRDNLSLGDEDADDDRIWAACEDAAVADTIRSLPLGLDERVGEDGGRLSGGERQRLMIARALLTDAPVLVLDEATAHLDAPMARLVLERVFRRRDGLTTIVITHDADVVPHVDLVLRADAGSITEVRPGSTAAAASTATGPASGSPVAGSASP